jgi:hypothetical protein
VTERRDTERDERVRELNGVINEERERAGVLGFSMT